MSRRWARGSAAVVGFFTIAAQTALVREFFVLFRGHELAFGVFFAAWFTGVAFGATLLRRLDAVRRFAARRAVVLLACYPVAAFAGLSVIPAVRVLGGLAAYEPTPLSAILFGAIGATAPVCLLTGVLFPTLCELGASDSRTGAVIGYAVESAGAIAGGISATLMLAAGLDGSQVIGLAGWLPVLAGGLGAFLEPRGSRWARFAAPLVSGLVCMLPVLGFHEEFSARRLRANLDQAELIRETASPYQLLTIARLRGQVALLANGEVSATFPPGPDTEARAALLASLPAHRDRAVVFGQGGVALAAALARYFDSVELVLLDRQYLAAATEAWSLSGAPRDAFDRVRVTVADERSATRAIAAQTDLWVVSGAEPATLLANRLFTLDFFEEVRARLSPGGVLASSVRSGENYLGAEVLRYGQSVYRTLAAAFPVVAVVPGDEAWFLAGASPDRLTLDAAVLARRYEAIAPAPRPFPPQGFVSLLPPDRIALATRAYAAQVPWDLVNRDDRPLATFLYLAANLRESDSPLASALWGVHESGWTLAVGLLVLLGVVLIRERVRRGRIAETFSASTLMAAAGGVSISLYVVILAAYQSRVGAAFGEVGAATGVFMAGLAGGGLLGRRFAEGRSVRARAAAFLLGTALAVACLPEVLSWVATSPRNGQRVGFALILFGSGLATGFAWPLAGGLAGAQRVAATLESADHWGAAVLSLATGGVVLALFGVEGTLWSLSGLLLVAVAVLAADGLLSDRGAGFFASRFGRLLSSPAFPNRLWPAALAFTALSAMLLWHASRAPDPAMATRLDADDLRRVETFQREEFRQDPFPHHRLEGVQDPAGDAVVATTQSVAADVKGYGGPLNLALSVGSDGRIRRARVLSHRETPAYVKGLPAFVQAIEGRDAREPLAVTDPAALDAMTGATVTREAALHALDRTREAVSREVLGLDTKGAEPEPPWWHRLAEGRVLYVILSLIALTVVHRSGTSRWRLAFLFVSLAAGGVWFNLQLSTSWLAMLARAEWPVFSGNAALWLLSAGALGLAVVFGPVYCAHLCPFGALQEVLSRLGSRIGLLSRPPARLSVRARGLKYVVLVLVVLALFAPVPSEALRFDPLSTAFSGRIAGASGALIVLAAAGSLLVFRFWCRVFCPVGAFFLLFNRVSAFLGLAPPRRYVACDLDVQGPADLECLQCNRCVRESRSRATPRSNRAFAIAYAALVVAAAGVIAWSFATGGSRTAGEQAAGRTLRSVDAGEILRLIQEDRLSDKEALFYQKVPR